MRGVRLVYWVAFFCLLYLGQAQGPPGPGGNAGPGGNEKPKPAPEEGKKSLITLSPGPEPDTTSASISITSTLASLTTAEAETSQSTTRTHRHSSSTIANSTPTQIPDNAVTSPSPYPLTTDGVRQVPDGNTPSTTISETSNNAISGPHKTLVIVLSTVLGSIGFVLAVLVLFLVSRHRSRRAYRRGVSPINDDEIESWRNSEGKRAIPSTEGNGKDREHDSNRPPNAVDWTTSPTSVTPPQSATLQRGASFHAKAPNARAGLTDEAVPGAEPFVPQVKRQSSRLSKAPPGHRRTKSRRSSTSAKSVRSIRSLPSIDGGSFRIDDYRATAPTSPNWLYSEDNAMSSHMFAPTVVTSSPATSVYNEVQEPGGLSPRPKSRPWGNMVQTNNSIGNALS